MTHVEVARHDLLYRMWPGDLHSQVYGKDPYSSDIGTNYSSASANYGKIDPAAADYNTFKAYWTNEISSTFGSPPYNSLAVHFYLWKPDVPNGGSVNSARQAEMAEWKTEAQTLGVQVQVTEYGVIPWTNTSHPSYVCDRQCVADRVDELRSAITANLSGVYRQLIWFIFYGAYTTDNIDWKYLEAFELSGSNWVLTNPVGQAWEADAD